MREFLPTLLLRPSPNFSSRRGTRVDLLMLHDCEGGYEGPVRWFELSRSSVSAHYVVRKDGGEATQVVDLADNAWHACTFNRRSVGVEMGGFVSRGFDGLCWQLARVCSPFCAIIYKFQSDMRARASDRVLPRTKISALRAAVITIRPTTRASCRDLLAGLR
jgi:N-acetylmuramoyl-L-alanine amidase